ncbi:hypothetical protein GW17_00012274 [Ensete ventricosum]|nr:hypothetical protein GW17_00012274 [Ensete ventricosum]
MLSSGDKQEVMHESHVRVGVSDVTLLMFKSVPPDDFYMEESSERVFFLPPLMPSGKWGVSIVPSTLLMLSGWDSWRVCPVAVCQAEMVIVSGRRDAGERRTVPH